ncbi:MAG: circularly permuted type 2 ATP-grasp protein, partial [Mycobacterium sp.]
MALPAANPHDTDNLLAGYRTARAQQALFEPRGGVAGGYDEFVDPAGNVRPSWLELAECVGERGRSGLEELRAVVRNLVDNDGITYIQLDANGEAVTNGDGGTVPGPWHLDALPLVISATDWDTLECGVVQRSRVLDA